MTPSILGIGTDIVDVRRIEAVLARRGERFMRRVFTERERAYADAATHARRRVLRYANRFAAKEAMVKAIGAGATGIAWKDIEVVKNAAGVPSFEFHGAAADAVASFTNETRSSVAAHLSLSDEYPYAMAFVLLSLS